MKPIRVVHIVPTPYLDGPGKVVQGILRHLDRDAFEPSFISIIKRPESRYFPRITGSLEEMNIPFRCLDISKPWDVAAPLRIAAFLRKQKADIAHTHLLRGNIYGRVAARLAGVKRVVSTVHSAQQWMQAHPLLEWGAGALDRLTVGSASVVVAVAEKTKEKVAQENGYNRCSVLVIPNGVDIDELKSNSSKRGKARELMSVEEGRFVVGFVGRLDEEKNPLFMLEVMGKVFKERSNAVFVVIGSGRLSEQVESRVRELGLGENVRLLGGRSDVYSLLCGLDAFFLPSLWEGLPISLCEAMATGLPCVATPVGGIPDMIEHGKSGFLFEPDNADEMADAIIRLADDRMLARSVGEAARETITMRFSAKHMARQYERLYGLLLATESGEMAANAQELIQEAV